MAVPKKRRSSSKRDIRRTNWKKEAFSTAKKALSLAKSVIKKLNIEENQKT
jgi:large subunit ribosomal protein L32